AGPRADLRSHRGLHQDKRQLPLVGDPPKARLTKPVERPFWPPPANVGSKVVSAKLVLVAACALIDVDGRVLLAQRPAGNPMAGLWEFAGGEVGHGERPEDSLNREPKDEVGSVVRGGLLSPRK